MLDFIPLSSLDRRGRGIEGVSVKTMDLLGEGSRDGDADDEE